jgi:hypothetical protein
MAKKRKLEAMTSQGDTSVSAIGEGLGGGVKISENGREKSRPYISLEFGRGGILAARVFQIDISKTLATVSPYQAI